MERGFGKNPFRRGGVVIFWNYTKLTFCRKDRLPIVTNAMCNGLSVLYMKLLSRDFKLLPYYFVDWLSKIGHQVILDCFTDISSIVHGCPFVIYCFCYVAIKVVVQYGLNKPLFQNTCKTFKIYIIQNFAVKKIYIYIYIYIKYIFRNNFNK